MSFYKLATNKSTGFDFFLVEGGRVVKKCIHTGVIADSHIVNVMSDKRCVVYLTNNQIKVIMGR